LILKWYYSLFKHLLAKNAIYDDLHKEKNNWTKQKLSGWSGVVVGGLVSNAILSSFWLLLSSSSWIM